MTDVTPTMLTPNTIATLRQADNLANQVLNANAEAKAKLSQMPLVLVPIHFDRYDFCKAKIYQNQFIFGMFLDNVNFYFISGVPLKR